MPSANWSCNCGTGHSTGQWAHHARHCMMEVTSAGDGAEIAIPRAVKSLRTYIWLPCRPCQLVRNCASPCYPCHPRIPSVVALGALKQRDLRLRERCNWAMAQSSPLTKGVPFIVFMAAGTFVLSLFVQQRNDYAVRTPSH